MEKTAIFQGLGTRESGAAYLKFRDLNIINNYYAICVVDVHNKVWTMCHGIRGTMSQPKTYYKDLRNLY